MTGPPCFRGSPLLEEPQTRFFVITCNIGENVVKSVENSVWATQRKNENKLNDAFRSAPAVILIFSVSKSSAFQGYCRMGSYTGQSAAKVNPFGDQFGRLFDVEWLRLHDLDMREVQHLRNPLDESRQVSFSRDGQELIHKVGLEVCRLIDQHVYKEDPENYEPLEMTAVKRPERSPSPAVVRPPPSRPQKPPPPPPVADPHMQAAYGMSHPQYAAAPYGMHGAPPGAPHPPPGVHGMPPPTMHGAPPHGMLAAAPPGYAYYPPQPWGVPQPQVVAAPQVAIAQSGKRRRRRSSGSSSDGDKAKKKKKDKKSSRRSAPGDAAPDFKSMTYEQYMEWWRANQQAAAGSMQPPPQVAVPGQPGVPPHSAAGSPPVQFSQPLSSPFEAASASSQRSRAAPPTSWEGAAPSSTSSRSHQQAANAPGAANGVGMRASPFDIPSGVQTIASTSQAAVPAHFAHTNGSLPAVQSAAEKAAAPPPQSQATAPAAVAEPGPPKTIDSGSQKPMSIGQKLAAFAQLKKPADLKSDTAVAKEQVPSAVPAGESATTAAADEKAGSDSDGDDAWREQLGATLDDADDLLAEIDDILAEPATTDDYGE